MQDIKSYLEKQLSKLKSYRRTYFLQDDPYLEGKIDALEELYNMIKVLV